jgi:hypothetical protein
MKRRGDWWAAKAVCSWPTEPTLVKPIAPTRPTA